MERVRPQAGSVLALRVPAPEDGGASAGRACGPYPFVGARFRFAVGRSSISSTRWPGVTSRATGTAIRLTWASCWRTGAAARSGVQGPGFRVQVRPARRRPLQLTGWKPVPHGTTGTLRVRSLRLCSGQAGQAGPGRYIAGETRTLPTASWAAWSLALVGKPPVTSGESRCSWPLGGLGVLPGAVRAPGAVN